jgi:hypothetical protein
MVSERDPLYDAEHMDIPDIRRQLRHALEQARKDSAERRARADLAVTSYQAFLRDVATPVFRMFASVVKAEGHAFAVITPEGAVRVASERHADDFMEIWLDTSLDPPQVGTRVSRQRGRDLTMKEALLRADAPIGGLTDEDVFAFLVEHIGPLVER